MKRLFSVLLCMMVFVGAVTPAKAVEEADLSEQVTVEEETIVEDSVSGEEEAIAPLATTKTRVVTTTKTYSVSGKVIAKIALRAKFAYDGSSVRVVSKQVTQKDTYDGWKFTQTSLTGSGGFTSGGKVTLKGNLKKTGVETVSVTITITCSKSGTIS